ncbi:thymidylate kinase [Tremella mesenterica]|uniref:Thymidylate kinase n=1 Tax=Tremella mesenterica TaxID=5217 RepID=A0A4Q1BN72_TREME|nr:thymidylate kinase [Tremella mesenterica]
MANQRGAFIVFEGLDRSGKSTQVGALVARLQREGRKVRLQKFPDRTTRIGGMIDAYLQSKSELDDHSIHLLFSANRWECANAIERDVSSGTIVIADRYAFSGIAFSAAKGLSFQYCLNPDTGLPLPDRTVYLTLSPEVAASRGAYGEERYETLEMQKRVREQFTLVAEETRRRHGDDRWAEINADGTVEEVEALIWENIQPVIMEPLQCLGKLWT